MSVDGGRGSLMFVGTAAGSWVWMVDVVLFDTVRE
jgi:hypothetical protein